MTAEKTVEKIKEEVQNLVAPKPANVPAQTKPHYWLYKQGKDVWNRWAREAFFDENGNDDGRIDGYIEDAKKKFAEVEDLGKHVANNIEEFKALKPFSEVEKAEIESKMQADYSAWLNSDSTDTKFPKSDEIKLPSTKDNVDFSYTEWKEYAKFYDFVFPYGADFCYTNFCSDVSFSFSIFCALAKFESARFSEHIDFNIANFSEASFCYASFPRWTEFSFANFSEAAYFDSASFSLEAYFSSASFWYLSLHKTDFQGDADFRNTKFETVPRVSGTKIEGVINFLDAQWPDEKAKESNPDFDALSYSQIKRRMQ